MARQVMLLHLALLCVLNGAWAIRTDGLEEKRMTPAELQKMREDRRIAAAEKIKAQADADAAARGQAAADRRKQMKEEEEAKALAESNRLAMLKAKADEMAALRPIIQAQRKAERIAQKEQKKQEVLEEAKRSISQQALEKAEDDIRAQALQEARDMVLQEMQAKMQSMRERTQKVKRHEMLKAKWNSRLAAERQAESQGIDLEEEKRKLANQKALQAAEERARQNREHEKLQKLEEKKKEKEEREKQYRVTQRLRQQAEAVNVRREQAREERDATMVAMQKAKEERAEAARARQQEAQAANWMDVKSSDSVLLTVKHSEGDEVPLRVQKSARFQVLLATVGKRLGIDPSALTISHNGSPLNPGRVIGDYGFEDGDIIEADTIMEH